MRGVRRGLFWAAGADGNEIGSVSEEVRYTGAGMTVLLTSALAFVSMAVALAYVFGARPTVYVPVALFWALAVFTFDRLVTSHVSDRSGFARLRAYLPRLAVAVFIGIVISEPLTLRVYEPEIDAQIAVLHQQAGKEAADRVRHSSPLAMERATLEARRKRNTDELAAANRRVDTAFHAFDVEEDGRGGTRVPGYGPVAKRRETELLRAQQDRAEVKRRVEADDARLTAALADVERRMVAEIERQQQSIRRGTGFLEREEALDALIEQHPSLGVRRWLLALLVLVVDTLPVFIKIFWPVSEHDRRVVARRRAREAARRRDEEVKESLAELRKETDIVLGRAAEEARRQIGLADIEAWRVALSEIHEAAINARKTELLTQIAARTIPVDMSPPPFVTAPARWDMLVQREPEPTPQEPARHPVDVRSRRPIRPLLKIIVHRMKVSIVGVRLGIGRLLVVAAIVLGARPGVARPAPTLLATAAVTPSAAKMLPVDGIATINVQQGGVSGTGRLVVTRLDDYGPTGFVQPLGIDLVGAELTKPIIITIFVPEAGPGQTPQLIARAARGGGWSAQPAQWDEAGRRLTTQVVDLPVDLAVTVS